MVWGGVYMGAGRNFHRGASPTNQKDKKGHGGNYSTTKNVLNKKKK